MQQPQHTQQTQQPGTRSTRLTRDVRNKMIGGVCAGIARQYGYDVTVVRVVAVLLTLVWGAGIILYLALWAIMPAEELQAGADTAWRGPLGGGAVAAGSPTSDELAERARRAADDFAIAARSAAEAARVAAEQLAEVAKAATAAGRESWEQQRAAREQPGESTSPPAPPETPPPAFETAPPPGPNDIRE